jgi:hypothetical protein
MSGKKMPTVLPPARRGVKKGWRPVTGELPPEQYARLEQLTVATGRRRTDVVAEAVIQYLDRNAA